MAIWPVERQDWIMMKHQPKTAELKAEGKCIYMYTTTENKNALRDLKTEMGCRTWHQWVSMILEKFKEEKNDEK